MIGGSTKNSKVKDRFKRVQPEYKAERVPDTEHLARMRALLVAAHQNEHFIKKLSEGNSYIPANADPGGSRTDMGQSFQEVYSKHNKKLQRDLDKADREAERMQLGEDGTLIVEEDGRPENPIASSTYSSHGDIDSMRTTDRLNQVPMGLNEDELIAVATQDLDQQQLDMQKYGEEKGPMDKLDMAVADINFNVALDAATAALLNDPQNAQPNEDYRDTLKNMNKNTYFKAFANAYQRKLNKVLEKHYNEAGDQKKGPSSTRPKAKQEKFPAYGDMVLGHLSKKQVFRKHAPQLFQGMVESKNKELAEGIRTYAKVPLPVEIKQRKDVLEMLKAQRKKGRSMDLNAGSKKNTDMYTIMERHEPPKLKSPKKGKDWGALPTRDTDPMKDTAYVRRLKKANYGKWYMQPEDYNRKADFITQQMKK